MGSLDAMTVMDLARLQRQSWVDEAVALRVAAGAAAAVAAVNDALADAEPGLMTSDAADFLAVLEALAGDGT
jgi:hypothetical protein